MREAVLGERLVCVGLSRELTWVWSDATSFFRLSKSDLALFNSWIMADMVSFTVSIVALVCVECPHPRFRVRTSCG